MPSKILLVDDDLDWLAVVSEVLEDGGYTVSTAENGACALDELERLHPVVVITDLQMPVMDGREFLARARSRDERVPVIVLTADGIQAAAGLPGAYRTMKKPVSVDELYAVVGAAAEHRISRLPLAKLWNTAAQRQPTRRVADEPRETWGAWLQRGVTALWRTPQRRLAVVGLGFSALVISTVLVGRRLQA
ncbi:MAG: atoC [Myxococcales bacterium]|nr:atoC [Myxococcales bacterium]